MKKAFSIMFMLMLSLAVAAKGDIRTVIYTTTPQMHCEGCEQKIKGSVRFVRGVKSITTDVQNQRVTITYDAEKTTPEKIEEAFSKVGYSVREVSASGRESGKKEKDK